MFNAIFGNFFSSRSNAPQAKEQAPSSMELENESSSLNNPNPNTTSKNSIDGSLQASNTADSAHDSVYSTKNQVIKANVENPDAMVSEPVDWVIVDCLEGNLI
jgi:hypothetical protein